MTTRQLLDDIRTRLAPALGDFALSDAEAIIERALNITRTRLYTGGSIVVKDEELSYIESVVTRRLAGEPLQYIFGRAYFYDREFFVSSDVLIPRPDTEVLVEAVLDREENVRADFIDIGTGSGIIPAILTKHRPGWSCVAVDVSYGALRVAARNVWGGAAPTSNTEDKGTGSDHNNVRLICCDILSAVKQKKLFDFIVSNPPYISSPQMSTLDNSVVNHEPRSALYGGEDGLDYYRMISACAGMYLKDEGRIYLEIGFDQGESVPQIFQADGWGDATIIKDLGGRDRVVIISN